MKSGYKVYANHVYNHQFKGTLKVVRRLFSITLDSEENREEELASLAPRGASLKI